MKNAQDVFDEVVWHLLKQNAKAENADGSCLYRADEGRACAVGCLISDEAYKPSLEGKRLTYGSVARALADSGIVVTDALDECDDDEGMVRHDDLNDVGRVLIHLQRIHDNEEPQHWRACFRTLANALDLDCDF